MTHEEQWNLFAIHQDIVVRIILEFLANFRAMKAQYPQFAWNSAGAGSIFSDGISLAIANAFGVKSQLDGRGADIPDFQYEITVGRTIRKSYGLTEPRFFIWLLRPSRRDWTDPCKILAGHIFPEDFALRSSGRHGPSVPYSIAIQRMRVIWSELGCT